MSHFTDLKEKKRKSERIHPVGEKGSVEQETAHVLNGADLLKGKIIEYCLREGLLGVRSS